MSTMEAAVVSGIGIAVAIGLTVWTRVWQERQRRKHR